MAKLPKWGDDAALAAWAGERIPARHAEVLFPELITVQPGAARSWHVIRDWPALPQQAAWKAAMQELRENADAPLPS
jgi:hypothetical protein